MAIGAIEPEIGDQHEDAAGVGAHTVEVEHAGEARRDAVRDDDIGAGDGLADGGGIERGVEGLLVDVQVERRRAVDVVGGRGRARLDHAGDGGAERREELAAEPDTRVPGELHDRQVVEVGARGL